MVTSRQAELVTILLQQGGTITAAAEAIGADRSWACKALVKSHVQAFARDLGMRMLGVAGMRALATNMTLMEDAKSEWLRADIAKDFMDRAGYALDNGKGKLPVVSINIDLG